MPRTVHPSDLADHANWSSGPPHALFDALRAGGPVHWVPGDWGTQDSGGYWAVLSHAEATEVGRDPDTYTSTRGAAYPTFADEVADGNNNMNMARFATRDTELGGRSIAAGQMVVMWFVAANRDPSVFDDPHRFVADRDPNNHLAFGPPGSPHFCAGHALGRLEGRVLLEDLLARPRLRPTAGATPGGGVFINALKALPVEVDR